VPEPELRPNCSDRFTAKLLAVVSVEHADRVQCRQPGCGHSVYRRIHIVRESGKLLVLGSTCFAKRYLTGSVVGSASFGSGGDGRMLTDAERQLLVDNTEALLAQFETEAEANAEAEAARSRAVVPRLAPEVTPSNPIDPVPRPGMVISQKETPWDWVKPLSSVLYLRLKDGSGWMRVQRRDETHVLMPWPTFDGWDESLPSTMGSANNEYGGYILSNVVTALQYLRHEAIWETKPGRWKDVMAEIASRNSPSKPSYWRLS
jgi:hypothetical protein